MEHKLDPSNINYDLPLLLVAIHIEDNSNILVTPKLGLEWISIETVKEYPIEYEAEIDWKEYKNLPKCYIDHHHNRQHLVLEEFDYLYKCWSYYLSKVRTTFSYQVPNYQRRK